MQCTGSCGNVNSALRQTLLCSRWILKPTVRSRPVSVVRREGVRCDSGLRGGIHREALWQVAEVASGGKSAPICVRADPCFLPADTCLQCYGARRSDGAEGGCVE